MPGGYTGCPDAAPLRPAATSDRRTGEPHHSRPNSPPRSPVRGMLTIAPAGSTRDETAVWGALRRGSHTNGWRIRGPGPQLLVRPAQPWSCLFDVVPGLLPGPAVHRPRPRAAGR